MAGQEREKLNLYVDVETKKVLNEISKEMRLPVSRVIDTIARIFGDVEGAKAFAVASNKYFIERLSRGQSKESDRMSL